MGTTIKLFGNKKQIASLVLLFASFSVFAESTQNTLAENQKNEHAGFYIIGGVLTFGLIAFLINKIASRYSNDNEMYQNNNRFISHRRHHHHKVIKKTA